MDEERHMGVRGKEVHAVTGSPFSDRSALVLRESDQVMMGDARMADLVTKAGAYKAHVGLHLEVMLGQGTEFVGSVEGICLAATTLGAYLARPPGSMGTYLAECPLAQAEPGAALSPGPLHALMADIRIPEAVKGSPLTSINLWASLNRTASSLHYDPYCNLLVVVCGRKTVRLTPPTADPTLRAHPVWSDSLNHADADLARSPRLPMTCVSLGPGDALFIPEGTWHSVASTPGTLAVNFWWRSAAGAALESGATAYHLRRSLQAAALHALRRALLALSSDPPALMRWVHCTLHRDAHALLGALVGPGSELALGAVLAALEAPGGDEEAVRAFFQDLYDGLPLERGALLDLILERRRALSRLALADVLARHVPGVP
ncbi:Lysine-specific demethylase 8 [Auxenochlorella protothecoides]|uniref:Lysine-specific demethylase 8 n=1 Tax=Auxenochlorella protothecoides TaxID=3075 RepID=A0A087SQB1_AUXPR|nr:Lysine-specific demethylase 8 [Auxenochlorella protothecoides]KFM27915.1 Lysine-specific demethylase 8 [Auxenochlorella protothecoides]